MTVSRPGRLTGKTLCCRCHNESGADSPIPAAPQSAPVELAIGDRVGVPWLGFTCSRCQYCLSGRENLCAEARFTGYQLDGEAFLRIAHQVSVLTHVETYDLSEANDALRRLKEGCVQGAAVLTL